MWSADPAVLSQLLSVLAATADPQSHNQSQAISELERLEGQADFKNYLAVVLCVPTVATLPTIRAAAGLLLKNQLSSGGENFSFLQQLLERSLTDEAALVRRTAANVIAKLVSLLPGGIDEWQSLKQLVACLLRQPVPQSPKEDAAVGGALHLFRLLLEDFSSMEQFSQIAAATVNSIFDYCEFSPNFAIQKEAMQCITLLIYCRFIPSECIQRTLKILEKYSNASEAMQRLLCRCVTALAECYVAEILPFLFQIANWMLHLISQGEAQSQLALEACSFWLSLPETECYYETITAMLPQALPVLLRQMRYGEADSIGEGELRPTEYLPRRGEQAAADEREEDSLDGESSWTLRKCAASTVDLLACTLDSQIFLANLLPLLDSFLKGDWKEKEAAILAVGAIADGCHEALLLHLPGLVSMLSGVVERFATPSDALLSAIACWSMSRYSEWISESEGGGVLQHCVFSLLKALQSQSKQVQKSALSALSRLFKAAGGAKMFPSLIEQVQSVLLRHLQTPFHNRTSRSLLYTAVASFSEASDQFWGEGLHALLHRWSCLDCTTDENENELFSLLEAVIAIISVSKGEASCFAVFQMAAALVVNALSLESQVAAPALDVMAAAVRSPLFSLSDAKPLERTLAFTFAVEDATILQAAFGLLGDCAKSYSIASQLSSNPEFLERAIVIAVICAGKTESLALANNSVWALGELYGSGGSGSDVLNRQAATVADALLKIASCTGKIQRSLMENASLTLGRIALVAPTVISGRLASIIVLWIRWATKTSDFEEFRSSFSGICAAAQLNLKVMRQFANDLVLAVRNNQKRCKEIDQLLNNFHLLINRN